MATPFQNFNLDLGNIAQVLSLIGSGTDQLPEIATDLGMGPRKIRDLLEWCYHLSLLTEKSRNSPQSLTLLGEYLLAYESWTNYLPLLDILYASLAKRHTIVNRIVNGLAYTACLRIPAQFSMREYRDFLTSLTPNVVDAKPRVILDRGSKFLNALLRPEGLGKLGIFVLTEDHLQVEVRPRVPAWQSAAYVLYSSWPENVARVRIGEVIRGQNSLGRIFFLTEPDVMILLSKLEQERAIALEIIADLNQIGLNPARKPQDFLEMLINEGG